MDPSKAEVGADALRGSLDCAGTESAFAASQRLRARAAAAESLNATLREERDAADRSHEAGEAHILELERRVSSLSEALTTETSNANAYAHDLATARAAVEKIGREVKAQEARAQRLDGALYLLRNSGPLMGASTQRDRQWARSQIDLARSVDATPPSAPEGPACASPAAEKGGT